MNSIARVTAVLLIACSSPSESTGETLPLTYVVEEVPGLEEAVLPVQIRSGHGEITASSEWRFGCGILPPRGEASRRGDRIMITITATEGSGCARMIVRFGYTATVALPAGTYTVEVVHRRLVGGDLPPVEALNVTAVGVRVY